MWSDMFVFGFGESSLICFNHFKPKNQSLTECADRCTFYFTLNCLLSFYQMSVSFPLCRRTDNLTELPLDGV